MKRLTFSLRPLLAWTGRAMPTMLVGWLLIGCGRSDPGHIIVQAGFPPSASLAGRTRQGNMPAYAVQLPGVFQMNDGILVKDVLPGQKPALLPIRQGEDGTITYKQCLQLLDHLEPVYGFRYAPFKEESSARLDKGEPIQVTEFYGILKKK